MVRAHGRLVPVEGSEPLTDEDTERVFKEMLTDEAKHAEFRAEHEVDYAYSVEGLSRFRVNTFRQRGSISIVCRAIPHQIKTIDELLSHR
jgi:twitching motility protein PilT